MNTVKITIACLAVLMLSNLAVADAIKCRDASGKVYVTDVLCPGASRVERVQGAEHISAERSRQAYEVNSANAGQLNKIESEKAAFNRQQAALQREYAEHDRRQAAAASVTNKADRDRKLEDDCIALSKKGRSARHEAMAKGCSWGFEADQRASEDRQRAQQPPPIITSCTGSGCWDTSGNRYNGNGQTLFRQDGKACTKSGDRLICN